MRLQLREIVLYWWKGLVQLEHKGMRATDYNSQRKSLEISQVISNSLVM